MRSMALCKSVRCVRGWGLTFLCVYVLVFVLAACVTIQQPSPVYRIYNTKAGIHYWTASETEKNSLQGQPDYQSEGVAFRAYTSKVFGSVPVYRFYNTTNGAHFYTISEQEKSRVEQTMPQYRYEGIVFYAYATKVWGTLPVYRFYNTGSGGHFYTTSEAERSSILKTQPAFKDEGIQFYINQ